MRERQTDRQRKGGGGGGGSEDMREVGRYERRGGREKEDRVGLGLNYISV